MKTKTLTLTGRALDYAVALAEGISIERAAELVARNSAALTYSIGPLGDDIIDREKISVIWDNHCEVWAAYYDPPDGHAHYYSNGTTRREAAMRCRILHKLGGELDIPEGLL